MAKRRATLTLSSEEDTRQFASALGEQLHPGDTVLLYGDIGAGKTFLARALIQSLQIQSEEVPSPTFTLIQTYETRAGDIWHCDLYRIGSIGEIEELGLIDVFQTSICLIEWPDRLGSLAPKDALAITLQSDDANPDQRYATLDWTTGRWDIRAPLLTREAVQ